jgi:hypothetical protein
VEIDQYAALSEAEPTLRPEEMRDWVVSMSLLIVRSVESAAIAETLVLMLDI